MNRADFEVIVWPCDAGGFVAEVLDADGLRVWADGPCCDHEADAREAAETWIEQRLAAPETDDELPIWRDAVKNLEV